MRRTMHALFAMAVLASPAFAQSEGPCTPCGAVQAPMSGCGNGTGSQLAAYMNSFPNHPNLWDSYPSQHASRLDCLYHHVNGCNCLDPKRNLHSHPSFIHAQGHPACGSAGISQSVVKAQLHAQPSTVTPLGSTIKSHGNPQPVATPVAATRAPSGMVAVPVNPTFFVTPLR